MNPKDVNYNIIIFILMIVTGCIIYFMYFQTIEKFTTTEPVIPSSTPANTDPTSTPAISNPSSTPANTVPTSTPANTGPTSTPANTDPTTTPANTDPTTTSNSSSASSATSSTSPFTTIPLCAPVPTLPTTSVLSRYFGVGFNIDYVNYNNTDTYLINHIPTVSNGTLGGCYAVSQDSLLTIKLKNSKDNTQLWTITQNKFTDHNGVYFTIISVSNNTFALQYENGNLALRPYNKQFEGQKWLMSASKITRSVPVLNYSPGSLFTTEFDPYSTPSTNTNNLTDSNMQQINDVLGFVKSGIQKYIGQLDNKQQTDQISSSSLGHKDKPLNVNFSIASDSNTSQLGLKGASKSGFEDVSDTETLTTTTDDFLSVMDKYGPSSSSGKNSSNNIQLYKKNDLDNEISKSQGCKILNMKDYTSNRVGSCNCKL
jgi:hypothetical protein